MPDPGLRFDQGIERTHPVTIEVDGQSYVAHQGETIAAALLAAGQRVLHTTETGLPRGIYCGMGVCHGCLVTVNGVPNVRACMTEVEPGLKIETQHGAGWMEGVLNEGR
jgi:predicted molibdopterin-dependent oxidoreductase YjgC